MPIYEYKCKNGHLFDVIQRMSDDALSECQVCGAPVQRVFHPVAVHFKGSGFYNTDYGTRRRSREAKEEASESKSSDGASKSDSAKPDSAKSESGQAASSAASAAAAAD